MQATFEEPYTDSSILILKPDHGFTNGNEILKVLEQYAQDELLEKTAFPKKSNPKKESSSKFIFSRDIIESVTLAGNQLAIVLNPEFNGETLLEKIRKRLYYVRKHSPAFKDMSKGVSLINDEKILIILHDNHGYANTEDILNVIILAENCREQKKSDLASAELPPESHPDFIKGGIINKYLSDEASLQLPIPQGAPRKIAYVEQVNLSLLSTMACSEEKTKRKNYSLKTSCFKATYNTHGTLPADTDKLTFICAGRKENASIPNPKDGRCVLVLTSQEFREMKCRLPLHVDVLIIKKLKSKTHGKFKNASCVNSRRLVILHAAQYLDLQFFIMLDDNISRVKFNPIESTLENSWDRIYALMEHELGELTCASVRTESPKAIKPGELGSKMFLFNMRKIKAVLPEPENIFLLFPPSDKSLYWGEDYYMQIVCHLLYPESGYLIIPSEKICLNRSRKNRNLAKENGLTLQLYSGLDQTSLLLLDPKYLELMNATYSILNRIIQDNVDGHYKHLQTVKNCDLLKLHSQANFQLPIDNITISDIDMSGDFIQRFKSKIASLELNDGFFRNYQQEAIKSIIDVSSNAIRLLLATGTGKTVVQSRLAQIAYHTMKDNEVVVIVTSTRALVNQYYADLVHFNRSKHSVDQQLAVPYTAIVKLSSDQESLHVSTFLYNEKIVNKKVVMVCCVCSLYIVMKNNKEFFDRVSLILYDEYQEYLQTLLSIRKIISPNDDTLMIGCTATPPKDDSLSTAFTYSRLQAIRDGTIAPVIADSLGVKYSASNLAKFIKALPSILKNQSHPGFPGKDTLSELKGIIYLPSVNQCKLAKIELKNAGIKSYCIHSRNPDYKKELRAFLSQDKPIVVLAVRMMRIGYDDKNLAWIIIAQHTLIRDFSKKCMIEQIIGRVMRIREDKIGYVLSFEDTYRDFLLPLTKNQVLKHPVSMDYLANDSVYTVSDKGCLVSDASQQLLSSDHVFRIQPSRSSLNNIKKMQILPAAQEITVECDDDLKSDENEVLLEAQELDKEEQFINFVTKRPLLYYYQAHKLNKNYDYNDREVDFQRLYTEFDVSNNEKKRSFSTG